MPYLTPLEARTCPRSSGSTQPSTHCYDRVPDVSRVKRQARSGLTSLSLPDCDLTHVTLGDMSSLTALDLSRNAPLRFIEGLETQTRLETLLLHQTPLLCVANALPAIMSPMQHMRRLRVLTLPFHLLEAHGGQDALRRSEVDPRDAAAEADTAFSGGWQQLAEPLMLAVVGSCPLWWLNARRVSIADRLRAFEYMLRHQGAVEGQKKRGVQIEKLNLK